MDRIRIVGGRPLHGAIPISGAKNATLPLMIASLLTDETLVLELSVADDDYGNVIGRGGRTASALRTAWTSGRELPAWPGPLSAAGSKSLRSARSRSSSAGPGRRTTIKPCEPSIPSG